MKLRFSLRTMMILVTCAAALCWWRDWPRRIANRFAEAVNDGHYGVAAEMIVDDDQQAFAKFMRREARNKATATVRRQTPDEWLRGECQVALSLEDFAGLGAALQMRAIATSSGVDRLTRTDSVHGLLMLPSDATSVRR